MNGKKYWQKAFFSAFTIWTICLNSMPVKAQDIVTSEDIAGGSSVFVYRQTRKPTQAKATFRSNVNRSAAQRTEARRKLVAQASTVAAVQRTRTKAVDPTTLALKKTTKQTGKPRVSDEQNSTLAAGAAETYLDRKDYDNAIANFKTALDFNPKNQSAKLGLSEAYTRKADETIDKTTPESAIPFYLEALKYSDKNAAAYAGLGEAYDSTGDSDKALINFEKALALNPKLTELYSPLGIIYFQKGEIAKADDSLTKAVAADPNDVDAGYYLGLVRYKQNRNDEAIASLTKFVQSRPDSADAHYYLGAAYDRVDRSNDAMTEFNRTVQLKPDYTDAWFNLGVENYNRGNYQESINAYQKVITLKNDYGQAYANLADVYRIMAGNAKTPKERYELYSQANSKYELAATFIKDDADLYSNWGFCLGRVAKWDLATQRLNTAIALNPDAADYTNLGWAYYNSAMRDTNSIRGSSVSEQEKAATTAKAQTKLRAGRAALEKAVALNPKYVGAFLNLGITDTDLGDYQASTVALKQAVALWDKVPNPNKSVGLAANNELGLAYRQLNDLVNAINQFKIVTKMDDNFAAGWYNLGEAQYRNGDVKEAKKAFDKLKKLNPKLAGDLNLIISGAVLTTPTNKLQNKVQEKNPLNKIPKIPY